MKYSLSILILDDDPTYRTLAKSFLAKNFKVYTASKPSEAFTIATERKIDILISDFQLPEMNGLEVIKKVKSEYEDIEIIMISSEADMDVVIEAMRIGAFDFFKKPFEFEDIRIAIERTKKYAELKTRLRSFESSNKLLSSELKKRDGLDIINISPSMENVKTIVQKVAQTENTSVLITGESGTGKELIARGIHYLSERKDKYFGAVNTSAIPDELFESEFFGHKKGAFTGAISDRKGWFEIADKGTLFLDEIGDMPSNLQIKLLRVLEDRKFIKVGSQQEQSFDIRIVAATNKDINELKSGKDFRLDLFHRIGTFEIFLPPLRERREDIPLLIEHFINYFSERMRKKIDGYNDDVKSLLLNYDFPGNIRELRNLMERAMILCESDTLQKNDFPQLQQTELPVLEKRDDDLFDLEQIEKNAIVRALEKTGNNKAMAAELLNIQWNALHRRMTKYGLS